LQKASVSFVIFVCVSVRPSVCPSTWNNSAHTEQIFMKLDILSILPKFAEKFEFNYSLTIITGTLQEDPYTFMIIYRSLLLRIINVLDRGFREN